MLVLRGLIPAWVDNYEMDGGRLTSQRILTLLVVITIALAAAAAFLSSTRESKEFAPNSPEGVIQLYLKAIISDRSESAASYFSSTSTCDSTDIDRNWTPENVRVNLSRVELEGEKAFVDVVVDISSGGPFDDYYTENHTFRLAKESGNWRILGIPWPLNSCEEPGK